MKIIRIDKTVPEKWISDSLEEYGVFMATQTPNMLSAITALATGLYLNREDADIIQASDTKNALAAISAARSSKPVRRSRQLPYSGRRDIKIAVFVRANSPMPKSIGGDVLHGVDLWLFESTRLMDMYPSDITKKLVGISCDPALIAKIKDKTASTPVKESGNTKNILWIGDITEKDALKQVLDIVNDSTSSCNLRICGTGRASDVMPVVKYSRSLSNKERIQWLGEDFDAAAEIAAADIMVQSRPDPCNLEAAGVLCGKPMVKPGELTAVISSESLVVPEHTYTEIKAPGDYITSLAEHYKIMIQTTD